MAQKELEQVAVIVPFPEFTGARVEADKRCQTSEDVPDGNKKDKDGNQVMKVKKINHDRKVTIKMPVPATDEEAQATYKVDLTTLIEMGARQRSYSLNKTDAYMATIGEAGIDEKGLTELVEGDIPIEPRKAGVRAETKREASKYTALKTEYNMTDEEIEAVLAEKAAEAEKKKKKA